MRFTPLLIGFMAMSLFAADQPAPAPGTNPETAPTSFITQLRAGKPQKIVFFGTSLTHGGAWVPQLSKALEAQFHDLVTFKNAGQNGQNSTWGLSAVESRVIAENPDVVFIEFTMNDSVERFHLSVEAARKNTVTIIDRILAARPTCQVILQIMNPAVGKPKGDRSYRLDQPAYEQMYRDLAAQYHLLLIDHGPAWRKLLADGEDAYKHYVPDGVHPLPAGYEKFVTPTILQTLGIEPPK